MDQVEQLENDKFIGRKAFNSKGLVNGIIIFLIGMAFGYLLSSKNSITNNNTISNSQISPPTFVYPTLNPTATITPTIDPRFTFNDNDISFTLPTNWKKKFSSSPYGQVAIYSPDYNAEASLTRLNWPGVIIIIKKFNNPETYDKEYKDMYDYIHAPNPGGAVPHDLIKTTVAGNQAIAYYDDFEAHMHTYLIWHANDVWQFGIGSSSSETETKYTNEIQSILSSLVFK